MSGPHVLLQFALVAIGGALGASLRFFCVFLAYQTYPLRFSVRHFYG